METLGCILILILSAYIAYPARELILSFMRSMISAPVCEKAAMAHTRANNKQRVFFILFCNQVERTASTLMSSSPMGLSFFTA